MQFGDELRQLRRARRLRQSDIGALVGCTGACIGTWERSEVMPRDHETILRIVASLSRGADIDRLGAVGRALLHTRYAWDLAETEAAKAEAEQRPSGFWRSAAKHLDESCGLLLHLVKVEESE